MIQDWETIAMNNIDFSSPAVVVGVVVVVVLIAVAIAVAVNMEKKRTERLRSQFGPEYDLLLSETGSRKKTEAELLSRIKRMEHLKIRELTVAERDRYAMEWEMLQSRFIDHPRGTVTEADELVNSLLMARGYPTSAFEQRAADISVNHAMLLEPYRHASLIAVRAGRNEATTEELRSAMIQYRMIFESLLGASTGTVVIHQRKLA
jgi:hypothetical protein